MQYEKYEFFILSKCRSALRCVDKWYHLIFLQYQFKFIYFWYFSSIALFKSFYNLTLQAQIFMMKREVFISQSLRVSGSHTTHEECNTHRLEEFERSMRAANLIYQGPQIDSIRSNLVQICLNIAFLPSFIPCSPDTVQCCLPLRVWTVFLHTVWCICKPYGLFALDWLPLHSKFMNKSKFAVAFKCVELQCMLAACCTHSTLVTLNIPVRFIVGFELFWMCFEFNPLKII